MRRRDVLISVFVVLWTLFFHYQTLRVSYLNPLCVRAFKRELPLIPLLFPPAGWIMFYRVDASYGFAEVYGIRDQQPIQLDPHEIFQTWAVGYDNIHRNMLISVLAPDRAEGFCRFLRRKFPSYDMFAVAYGEYQDVTTSAEPRHQVVYRCP